MELYLLASVGFRAKEPRMPSEHRRRQILDGDLEEARLDARTPGKRATPGNGRVQEDPPQAEDSWVNSFMSRLAALVRDVSGREK
jgi:hypothetical protein